jgi:hypothetical protein
MPGLRIRNMSDEDDRQLGVVRPQLPENLQSLLPGQVVMEDQSGWLGRGDAGQRRAGVRRLPGPKAGVLEELPEDLSGR